jgi:hypothetical protein
MENEFFYVASVVDGPLGIAKVLQGDVAGGIKFMAAAIERDAKAGNAVSTDIGRLCLAETYMEILAVGDDRRTGSS